MKGSYSKSTWSRPESCDEDEEEKDEKKEKEEEIEEEKVKRSQHTRAESYVQEVVHVDISLGRTTCRG